jgi:heme-degrading monooxygenase HmoA
MNQLIATLFMNSSEFLETVSLIEKYIYLKPDYMGFMRIGTFKVQPDKVEELIRIYVNEAIPVIKAAPGNLSAFILRQHNENNSFQACTAWKTKEDAENYDKSGQAMEMVNKVRYTFAGPPALLTYEVFGL